MSTTGWRFCPHWFGWSYNTHRRRRFCRLCAKQQRMLEDDEWVDANPEEDAAAFDAALEEFDR